MRAPDGRSPYDIELSVESPGDAVDVAITEALA